MSTASPLLDFFRRGEAARDVKLLAAAGALAPRAHEQLSILVHLMDDGDQEVRETAGRTLAQIPVATLQTFLGRSDVAVGLREFFAGRGVFPSDGPAPDADVPLVDAGTEIVDEGDPDESREGLVQRLAKMTMLERLKAAVKGTREMRAILIRDPNKMIAAAVLSSPKITEQEIEGIAKMANVSEDVLRIIATNRAWTKNYAVIAALSKNPKTPVGMSLNLLSRLNEGDVKALTRDRNVPEALRTAARRKVAQSGP